MKNDIEVSFIVVHYGATNEVFRCLESLRLIRQRPKGIEFIFVDNEEVNTTGKKVQKKYPWIKYVKSPYNLGFGGGRNLGRSYAIGKYLFCLDSDFLVDYKSLESLLRFIKKHRKIGLISPKLVNISGKYSLQATKELTPVYGVFYLSFLQKFIPNNPFSKSYLLSDWDRSTGREVEVVQLGSFLIRSQAFDDIGGFDQKMFLYFEENDLSSNLRAKGWKIYFYPEVNVTHLESKGTPKRSYKIKQAFAKSRFRYFKKHYGIFPALLVELTSRISKTSLILLAIIILAAFLRFYRIQENLIFQGEIGTDYINVLNILEGKRTFLLGPRTSHEWFFIPPLAYWIYAAIMVFGNLNPLWVTYFWAIIGVATVFVCYHYVKELFDKNSALISSFLLAISPAWISLTRDSRYNALAAVLFFPFLSLLRRSLSDNGKSLFKLGFTLGLMMSFFPSPILLIPGVIALFLIYGIRPKSKYIFQSFLGFIIPNLAYLYYEISHKFEITLKLISWIPYRVFGFFGLYHKNTVTPQVLSLNINSFYHFIGDSMVKSPEVLLIVIFLAIITYSLFRFKDSWRRKDSEKSFITLIIIFLVSYLGLFVHGDPPKHYYLAILPIPIIVASLMLSKTRNKYVILVMLGALLALNIWNLKVDKWFYGDLNTDYKNLPVPYGLQKKIVSKIIMDSEGRTFSLGRVGVFDKFENNFANNYIYLMRIQGVTISDMAKLKYTIYEDTSNLPVDQKVFWVGSIAVVKNE